MITKTEWNDVTLYTEDLHEEDPRVPAMYEGNSPLFQVDVWNDDYFLVGFIVRDKDVEAAIKRAQRYLMAAMPPTNGENS